MEKKQRNWFRRHWILTTITGIFLLLILLSLSSDNPDSFEVKTGQNNLDENSENPQITEQSKVDYFDIIQVTDNKSPQYDSDVYENVVVWVDERNENKDIFMKDIETGEEKQITSPAI